MGSVLVLPGISKNKKKDVVTCVSKLTKLTPLCFMKLFGVHGSWVAEKDASLLTAVY